MFTDDEIDSICEAFVMLYGEGGSCKNLLSILMKLGVTTEGKHGNLIGLADIADSSAAQECNYYIQWFHKLLNLESSEHLRRSYREKIQDARSRLWQIGAMNR